MNSKDPLAGAVFIALGAIFAAASLGLEMGSAIRMGPGYFPLVLALILIALGIGIVVQTAGHPASPVGSIPWRGLVLILAAPIAFGLTVRGLGLLPAIAIVVLVSAFASRRMGMLFALALTVGLKLGRASCGERRCQYG